MCQNSVTKHNTQCSWNTYAYISIFLWYQTCSFLEGLESAGAVCFVFSPSQPTALHSEMKRHSANVLDKITLHVFEKISRPVSILTNNTVKGQIVSFLLLIYFYSNTSTYKWEKKKLQVLSDKPVGLWRILIGHSCIAATGFSLTNCSRNKMQKLSPKKDSQSPW